MLDIKATLSVGLVLAGSILVPAHAEVVTFASSEEPVTIEESMTEASPETIYVEDGEEFVSCYDDVYVDACHKPGVFGRIKNSIDRIRCHFAGSLSFGPRHWFAHKSDCTFDECCEEVCCDACSCGDLCECDDAYMWEETAAPAEEVPLESTPVSPEPMTPVAPEPAPMTSIAPESTSLTSVSPNPSAVTSTAQPCKDCGPYVKPAPVRTSIPATPAPPASPRIVGSMRTDIAAPVSERTSPPTPIAPTTRPITEKRPTTQARPTNQTRPVMETPRVEQDFDLVPVPAEPISEIQPMSGTLPARSPGHAENFSWIQGELQRVHTRGGAWVIRYLPLDQTDEYGGSVVLTFDRRLESFRDGQQVRITGELIQARSGSTQEGPRYRIRQISAVDR